MSLRTIFAFSLLLCTAAFAHEPANEIFLTLRVEQSGALLASPGVLLRSTVPAELQIGEQLKLQVTAAEASGSADLQIKVYALEGPSMSLVGTPRVLVSYGQESVVSWSSPNGVAYRIALTPRPLAPPGKV